MYTPYPKHKTFVIQHTQCFGEQGGSPIKYLEIVGSYDTMEEAEKEGNRLFPLDDSGWTYDQYIIRINPATEEGKRLIEEETIRGEAEAKILMQKVKDNPEKYQQLKVGEYHVIIEKNPTFEQTKGDYFNNYGLLIPTKKRSL